MITFIAPAFKEKYSMYMFIGCLLAQTSKEWKCIIYHNGEDGFEEFWGACKQILDYDSLAYEKFTLINSKENSECWGAKNRQKALDLVDTEYVIQTSIQDYWIPIAVEEMSNYKEDFLYFNGINHIFGYGGIIDTHPSIGRMDWGNFRVRTEIAKKVGINKPEEFCADGMFVRDLLKSGLIKSIRKINKCLTIHN